MFLHDKEEGKEHSNFVHELILFHMKIMLLSFNYKRYSILIFCRL